ncbi:LysR family transcriptional regulator [Dyella sp. 20L07]|uniref:LysR family transcriptional regulator n=1 Tax=Dyella sp. 20L07 TaxID=3384240 RepID=UPI003D29EBE0
MDNLSGLQTFVQVADTRSFVDAGRLQGVSASAIGKSISRLEQSLGVRLFHRSTRSVTLTAEGQLFLVRCRRILTEMDLAQTELSSQTEEPRGTLRISLPLVSNLVLPLLSDFMQAYPSVQLDLDLDDRLVDVIGEGFDAVLRVGEPTDSRLSARRVGTFRRCLVASPEYLARAGTPQTPADLVHHQCLHYRFPSSGRLEVWPLHTDAGEAFTPIPVSMVCNDVDTRVCFVQRGRGIAYVPEHSVRQALKTGALVSVLDNYMSSCGTFYLLWPSGRHVLPKLRAFIDFMSERLLADECV